MVAPLGDDGRDVFVLFAGMFSGIPRSTAVEPSTPFVVGSLPPVGEFSGPVFDQVHHELFAAGEMPENTVEIPVVLEHEIFQAIPRVVGSLPPVEEFTGPVYNPFHQEQFSAGETTVNIANIPVVQEQVLVQAIPRFVGSLPPVEEFTAYVARRPSPLVEVRPSVREQRHVVEQLADIAQATSRPYFWNRRTRETMWQSLPGIRVVWVGVNGVWRGGLVLAQRYSCQYV